MKALAARAVGVCAVLAAAFVLWHTAEIFAVLLGAIAVAAAVEPLVRGLRSRWFGRGAAIVVAYLLVSSVCLITMGLAIRAISHELPTLTRDLAHSYEGHRHALRTHGSAARAISDRLPSAEVVAKVATPSLAAAERGMRAVFSFAWLLLLALFWSYGGAPFEARCLALFPAERRPRIAAAWRGTLEATGRAIATLVTSLSTSFVSLFLAFHLLGIPYGGVIAALVAGIRLVPFAGGAAAVALAGACGALAGPWHAVLATAVTCALLIASRHLLGRNEASPTPSFLLALCTFALVQLSGLVAALLGPVLAASITALLGATRRQASARTSQA